MLAFTIPAGTAAAVAGLAAYAIARGTPGVSDAAARTAATLAVFTVGLWVLALIAGLPALLRIALVAAMTGPLVLLSAIPLAQQVFALQLPPASVCAWVSGVVLACVAGLTLWTYGALTAGQCHPGRRRIRGIGGVPGNRTVQIADTDRPYWRRGTGRSPNMRPGPFPSASGPFAATS